MGESATRICAEQWSLLSKNSIFFPPLSETENPIKAFYNLLVVVSQYLRSTEFISACLLQFFRSGLVFIGKISTKKKRLRRNEMRRWRTKV